MQLYLFHFVLCVLSGIPVWEVEYMHVQLLMNLRLLIYITAKTRWLF